MLLISEETEELLQGLRELLTPSEFLNEAVLTHKAFQCILAL